MNIYQKILGLPFVYNHIRPRVVGGINMAPVYERLGVNPTDTVLDVGCGTGIALDHLRSFGRYVGVDTDPVALTFARQRRVPPGAEVSFSEQLLTAQDVERIQPDVVVLAGLLHHVDDAGCVELLESLLRSRKLRRVVTQDIAYLPHRLVNNVFSALDRGPYCRHPGGYEGLAKQAGYDVKEGVEVPASPGNERVSYWVMNLEPPPRS